MHLVESEDLKKIKAQLITWDLEKSRKIFAYDFGKTANYIAIFHCVIFMEESFLLTLTTLHFLMGQQWNLTIKYVIVLLANVTVTLNTKDHWGRPRPNLNSDFRQSSKTMFFRKKQKNGSMPSGDSIQAFALLTFFYFYGTATHFWVYLPMGVVVCLSRVYFCCHYISDITVGAIFGAFTSFCVVQLLFKACGLDGGIDQFAAEVLSKYVV